ncbi:MAG: hypothetical protein KDH96_01550 [Candidatus Riesia sp.]|nr:hypothetical protein [Candidatus Riesia sp.]
MFYKSSIIAKSVTDIQKFKIDTVTPYLNLRIIFTNSTLPLSPIIRFVTWSKFSHMAVVINDKWVMHSDFNGVHIELLNDLKSRSKNWTICEYECKNPQAIINSCLTLLGSPYDYGALIGIALRRIELQDESKYVCSEFPAAGCFKANQPFFCTEFSSRITPQHWLMLPHTVIMKSI